MRAQLMRHQVPLFIQQNTPSVDEGGGGIISYQRVAFFESVPNTRGGLNHLLKGRGGKKLLGEPFAFDARILIQLCKPYFCSGLYCPEC